MNIAVRIVAAVIVMAPVLYIGSCSAIDCMRERGLAHVKAGDSESQVIAAMGQPSDREIARVRRLPQYGAPECTTPCSRRLWYPNRLSLTGEAWMVDLDASGHVAGTAHITSP